MPRQAKSAGARLGAGSGKKKKKSAGGSGKKSAGKKRRGKSAAAAAAKQEKPPVDIMSPAAMENVYIIAHGVRDALELRGFASRPGTSTGKGRKGKKGGRKGKRGGKKRK